MSSHQHLPLFPTPLPDEMLFSLYCRYHALSGNSQASDTRLQLTGHDAEGFRRRPATKFMELYERLPVGIFPSYEDLLLRFTLYPYFLTITRFPIPPNNLAAGCDEWLAVFPEIRRRDSTWLSTRKFCPRCVVEDTKRYGVAYWHKSHQPDECVVCCAHQCRLVWTCPYCGGSYRMEHELYLPSLSCPAGHIIDPESPMFARQILAPELIVAEWCRQLLLAHDFYGSHASRIDMYRLLMRGKCWDWDMVDGRMTRRNRHYVLIQIRKFWGLDRYRRLPPSQNRLYPAGNAPCLQDSIAADDISTDPYWLHPAYRRIPWLTSLLIVGYLMSESGGAPLNRSSNRRVLLQQCGVNTQFG